MAGLDPTNLLQAPVDQSQTLQNPYPPGYVTPDMRKAMYDYSQALLNKSEEAVPGTKGGWTVGVQHLVDALMGGQQRYQANQNELGSRRYDAAQQPQAPGPYMYPPNSNNVGSAPSDTLPEGAAKNSSKEGKEVIGQMESGGKYDNVTTTTNPRTGQKQSALGKYGVMDFNVAPWTKEVLGKAMTPQEFLQSKEAQDKVAQTKLAEYTAKFGPEGAGRAWIGGEGGVNHPERTDALGTSVGDYGSRYVKALGFNGQPAGNAPATDAIALALNKGTKPTGIPGTPAGAPAETYVAPFAVSPRPRIDRQQYERMMGSPWMSDAQKETIRNEYMQQNYPVTTPYMGGAVISNPNNPSQQFFSPGVQWNEYKTGDSSYKAPVAVVPDGKGGFKTQVIQGASPTGAPAKDSEIKPPSIGPGTGPAAAPAATPAPAAPVAPPAAAPAPVAPPAPVPAQPSAGAPGQLPFGINGAPPAPTVGQNPAANQVASNVPMATAGTAPVPGPAETGNAAIAKAQGALPPSVLPGAPPSALPGPMGQKVAAALATQPPPVAPGVKTAEIPPELRELRDFSLDTKQRGAVIENDAKNYNDAQKTYTQNGGPRALNAIAQLNMAKKLVDDPRFYSGLLSNWVEGIQKIRATLGKDPGMAGPMEIFNKIISGDVVQELKQQLGGLGQIRLAEINLINQSVANLYNTPASNKAVLDIMTRVNQQSVKIGEIARAYAAGWRWDAKGNPYRSNEAPTNAGLADAINQYTVANPLFSDQEIANTQKTFGIAQQEGKAKPNPHYTGPIGGSAESPTPTAATPASATTTTPPVAAPANRPSLDDIFGK